MMRSVPAGYAKGLPDGLAGPTGPPVAGVCFKGRCGIERSDQTAAQHACEFVHSVAGVQHERRMRRLETQECGRERVCGGGLDFYLEMPRRLAEKSMRASTARSIAGREGRALGFGKAHDFERMVEQPFESRVDLACRTSVSCWHVP